MKRGTKARPELRLVAGTQRADQQTPGVVDVEPADISEVKMPKFLKTRAKKIWEEYAPDRIKFGFLRPEDAHLFGQLCHRLAQFEEDPDEFRAADLAELRKRLETYGMAGPSSRARFKIGDGKKKDPGAKYLSGRPGN